jgi:hypothetical protein
VLRPGPLHVEFRRCCSEDSSKPTRRPLQALADRHCSRAKALTRPPAGETEGSRRALHLLALAFIAGSSKGWSNCFLNRRHLHAVELGLGQCAFDQPDRNLSLR